MTDLELIDKYIEESRQFIPPALFREINYRGLYNIIKFLPTNIAEAKSIARARLGASGKYIGDSEIEQIAGEIDRLNFLRKELAAMNMADVDKILPVINEITKRSEFVRNYYK